MLHGLNIFVTEVGIPPQIAVTQHGKVTGNRASIRGYIVRQRHRYRRATGAEKTSIVAEVIVVNGSHRRSVENGSEVAETVNVV